MSQRLPSVSSSPLAVGPADRHREGSRQAGCVGKETMLTDSLQALRKELRLGEALGRGMDSAAPVGAEKPLLSPAGGGVCSSAAGQGLGSLPEGRMTLYLERAVLGDWSQPEPAWRPWLSFVGLLQYLISGTDTPTAVTSLV